MEFNEIQKVADEWHKVTWEVIEFKDPGVNEISKLFQKTCEIIEEYRKENLVPKEISRLLLEMHDFGWWVSDLKETPLHCYYQEIVSVVYNLNTYFLTPVSNSEKILKNIDKIV